MLVLLKFVKQSLASFSLNLVTLSNLEVTLYDCSIKVLQDIFLSITVKFETVLFEPLSNTYRPLV